MEEAPRPRCGAAGSRSGWGPRPYLLLDVGIAERHGGDGSGGSGSGGARGKAVEAVGDGERNQIRFGSQLVAAAAVSRRPAHLLLRTNRKLSSGRRRGGGSLRAAGCHLVAGACSVRRGSWAGCGRLSCRDGKGGERQPQRGRLVVWGDFLRTSRRRQLPLKPSRSEAVGSCRLSRAGGEPGKGERWGRAGSGLFSLRVQWGGNLSPVRRVFKASVGITCSVSQRTELLRL